MTFNVSSLIPGYGSPSTSAVSSSFLPSFGDSSVTSSTPTSDPKEFQRRVESLVKTISVDSIPVQHKSAQCSVKCFETNGKDIDGIHRCLTGCQKIGEHFSNTLQKEINTLQSNISATSQVCMNRYSSAFNEARSESERATVQEKMDACMGKCFEQYSPHIDEIKQRMDSVIQKTLSQF